MYKLSNIFDYYVLMTLLHLADDTVSKQGWPTNQQAYFIEKVENYMLDLEYGLSETIVNYLTMASFGEMRHAFSQCVAYYDDIPIGGERSSAYDESMEYDPIQMLGAAVNLYKNYSWDRSYGGEKWGHIAEFALLMRTGRISRQFFIDHIIDLVHNRGFAFDKSAALRRAGLEADIDDGDLMRFLNEKTFSENLLVAKLSTRFYRMMTNTTRLMVRLFYHVFFGEEAPVIWGYAHSSWPTATEIQWGDKQVRKLIVNSSRIRVCESCDKQMIFKNAVEVHNHTYCSHCYRGKYWVCSWCGRQHRENDVKVEVSGNHWCERCAKSSARLCPQCNKMHMPYAFVTQEDGSKICMYCNYDNESQTTEHLTQQIGEEMQVWDDDSEPVTIDFDDDESYF